MKTDRQGLLAAIARKEFAVPVAHKGCQAEAWRYMKQNSPNSYDEPGFFAVRHFDGTPERMGVIAPATCTGPAYRQAGTICCAPTNAGAVKTSEEGSVNCCAMVKAAPAGASGAKRCELISR